MVVMTQCVTFDSRAGPGCPGCWCPWILDGARCWPWCTFSPLGAPHGQCVCTCLRRAPFSWGSFLAHSASQSPQFTLGLWETYTCPHNTLRSCLASLSSSQDRFGEFLFCAAVGNQDISLCFTYIFPDLIRNSFVPFSTLHDLHWKRAHKDHILYSAVLHLFSCCPLYV